ncbi:MAG: DNA recombination protein RmuC [Bacteroidota bacterium]
MDILLFAIVAIIAFAIAYTIALLSAKNKINTQNLEFEKLKQIDTACFQEKLNNTEKQMLLEQQKANQLEIANIELQQVLKNERNKILQLSQSESSSQKEIQFLNERLDTQKQELNQMQVAFKQEFENLANSILKQNSNDFLESNHKSMISILSPLKEKIVDFEQKITKSYDKSLRDTFSLKEELRTLKEMNMKISEDANNLTKALKGDVKKQGNWGEIVLERVLERSGLTKGEEFETQATLRNDDGDLLRPDVLVHLPDNKQIIIDSKVSLVAYEQYVNAEEKIEKEQFLKFHIDSIKNHVKLLSEKNYSGIKNLDTPDFVLLFMPIESSFSIAIQNEIELFNFAWDKKIVIVSPTTLLATLRTISSIWKQEKQVLNAQEIARQGALLYDKFEGFLKDFEKMENHLKLLHNDYDEAKKKLTTGRGNVISQAEKLKELGVRTNKQIPQTLKSADDEE